MFTINLITSYPPPPPPPQKKFTFFYIEINTHLKTFTSYFMIESIAVLTYFYV